MAFGRRPVLSRNRAAAVEFQFPVSMREIEDYAVELDGVTVLELKIVPDTSGGQARASLMGLRLGR